MKPEQREIRDYDGGHTALIKTSRAWADAIPALVPPGHQVINDGAQAGRSWERHGPGKVVMKEASAQSYSGDY